MTFMIFITLIGVFFGYVQWYERKQVQAPTKLIIEKLYEGKILVVKGYSNPPSYRKTDLDDTTQAYTDYTIIDTHNGFVTWLTYWAMDDHAYTHGDFDWMNRYESTALYIAAGNIQGRRDKNYEDACAIEKAARDEKTREVHKKIYEK